MVVHVRKVWKRCVVASLISGSFIFVPEMYGLPLVSVAHTEVKMYVGTGEDYASPIESQEVAMLRAKEKAIKRAKEQAGVVLKNYSRSINAVISDDELATITANTYKIIGNPTYERVVQKVTDASTVIIWKATVNVNIDDNEIIKWISTDNIERSKLVKNNKELQVALDDNESRLNDLREKAKSVSTVAEKEKLKKEFDKIDTDFLVNQKMQDAYRAKYTGDYQSAVKLCEEIITLDQNNAEAWLMLGNIYFADLTDNKKAIDCYIKVTKVAPETIMAAGAWDALHFIYFLSFNDKNKSATCYQKALEIAHQITRLHPNDDNAWRVLGDIYGSSSKAAEYYQKAISINPKEKGHWYALHNYYMLQKDYRKATEISQKLLEKFPHDDISYILIGMDYGLMGNLETAISYLKKAVQINSHNPNGWSSLGLEYKLKGDYTNAIRCYKRSVELAPNSHRFLKDLGDIYRSEMKDYTIASEYYTKALSIAPTDVYIWGSLALMYKWNLNKPEKALECYRKIVELDKYNYDKWNHLADAYCDVNSYEKAIECYNESIKLSPNAYAYNKRGGCYKKLGDTNRAIADYTQSLRIDPKYKWSYKSRGECYREIGENAKAQADLAKYEELDKN